MVARAGYQVRRVDRIAITYERWDGQPIPDDVHGFHDWGAFDADEALRSPAIRDNLRLLEEVVLPHVGPAASFLDLGCHVGGYGVLLRQEHLPFAGWSYSGIETSEELCRRAEVLNPGRSFVSNGGKAVIPLPDGSHDAVFASGVLQYVPEWPALLQEIIRVCRQVIVVTRLPLVRFEPSFRCLQRVNREQQLLWVFQRQEWEHSICNAGLSVMARDWGVESIGVAGVSESVVFGSYVLTLA